MNMKSENSISRMPIRVLHVVTQMERGGLETMIMNYYRNIDRNYIQFDFLTHRPVTEKKAYDDEIESLGGRIYHLPRLNPLSYKYRKELDNFWKQHPEYTIVHVHLDCMSAIVLRSAKKNGITVRIAHCHSSKQDCDYKYPIKVFYKKVIKKYATQLFACGKQAGKWMFETDNFEVLLNSIDVSKYVYNEQKRNELRHLFGVENQFVVGHVGRFDKVKNHRFIIDVFKELLKRNDDCILILVGDGSERKKIEKYVEQIGVQEKVIFLGIRSDVYDLLQMMDSFVLPSLYEGLPVSVIEAQAAAVPCIISENVPLECKITNIVQQISLRNIEKWVTALEESKNIQRVNMKRIIEDAGYDIHINACSLQKMYLSQLQGR